MKKSMALVAALALSFCSGAFAASQPAQPGKHPVAQNNKAPQHTNGGKHNTVKKSGNHKRPQNNSGKPQANNHRPQNNNGKPQMNNNRPQNNNGKPQINNNRPQNNNGNTMPVQPQPR